MGLKPDEDACPPRYGLLYHSRHSALSAPSSGVRVMPLTVPRGAYATPLAVALAVLAPPARGEQPTDLSDYRTVATAQTATPAALVGADRRPGYLGVNAEPDAGGLRVAAVEPDSPAGRADIRPGDHRRSVDGIPVPDLNALRDVLLSRREGDRMIVAGLRDGKSVEYVV